MTLKPPKLVPLQVPVRPPPQIASSSIASPPKLQHPTAQDILQLQRQYGNRAVSRWLTSTSPSPIQRTFQVATTTFSAASLATDTTLKDKIKQEVDKNTPKTTPAATKKRIVKKIKELARDAAVYPASGKRFTSYKAVIARAKTLLVPVPIAATGSLPYLNPIPIPGGLTDYTASFPDAGDEPAFGGKLRRAASELRIDSEQTPPTYQGPEEFERPLKRRRGMVDKLAPADEPYTYGTSSQKLTSGNRNYSVPPGGGKGSSYKEAWDKFVTTLGSVTEVNAATIIMSIINGNPAAGTALPIQAASHLDEILGIIMYAEGSRGTQAPLCAAAAINNVANGVSGFADAFSGATAAFLGAGEGGAAALRGETPTTLLPQQVRSNTALRAYLKDKIDPSKTFDAAVKRIVSQIRNNLAAYKRVREGAVAPPPPPPLPVVAPSSP